MYAIERSKLRPWRRLVYVIIAIGTIGYVLSCARVARAESPNSTIYMPLLQNSDVANQVVEVSEVGPPEFDECAVTGWFTGIGENYGRLFCTWLFLTSLQIANEISPEPEPEPTPPPPTPTPEGRFEVIATGSDLETPGDECRWVPIWRVCMIHVEFKEINVAVCPNAFEIGLNFSDSTYPNGPIKPADYWLDEEGELWLKFEPLMYDSPTGYEAGRYTAKAICTK